MQLRHGLLALILSAAAPACDSPGGGSQTVIPLDGQGDVPADAAPVDTADEDGAPLADVDPQPDAAPGDVPADAPIDTSRPPADVAPDTTTGPVTLGSGVLLSEIDSAFVNVAAAAARLTREAPPALAGQAFGPCKVGFSDPNAAAQPFHGYDAGVLSVGGTTPPVTFSPAADAKGTGYTSSLPSGQEDLLPGGGALVTFSAAGGADVPAFSLVVQAPEPVSLTSPSTGLGASLSTGADLTVTWNKGTGQQVLVTLAPLDGSYKPVAGPTLVCDVPDTGTLVVAKEALAAVRGGVNSLNAAFGLTRLRQNTTAAGGFVVPAALTRSTGGPVQLTP